MPTKKTDIIQQSILTEIQRFPGSNPSGTLQKQFGISRESIRRHFNDLIDRGILVEHGYGKGRIYFPGPQFVIAKSIREIPISVDELVRQGEDEIFKRHIAPLLDRIPKSTFARIQYAATECLNNVIDHSSASHLKIKLTLSAKECHLAIEDDGKGVFASLQKYFSLGNTFEAAGELAKGKRTTAPDAHAGEGLFFSARIADHFTVEANDIYFTYIDAQEDWSIGPLQGPQKGSSIRLKFDLKSSKTTKSVFDRYTKDYRFVVKSPRIVEAYEIALPPGHILSRSEAKKILAGAETFENIVLDFKNVESIGQGFADQVFRVFKNQYPSISIESKNANDFILRMIAHAKSNETSSARG